MAKKVEKSIRYLVWDGTYSGDKAGTLNGGFADAKAAAAKQAESDEEAREMIAEMTATLKGCCCFCLCKPKRKVSVRIAATDRFFRPQRGNAFIRIRLKREYHIRSLMLRIYRNYDDSNQALPAGNVVYQEVLGYGQITALPQARPESKFKNFETVDPDGVTDQRRKFLEIAAHDGDGGKFAAWEHAPFKVRIWVSSDLSPADLFAHVNGKTDPAASRGRTAHDQSTWTNTFSRDKTRISGDDKIEARDILLDRPGVNLITLGYIVVDGFSSGKGNGDLVLGRKIAEMIDQQFGTRCLVISNHPTLMRANFLQDQVFWDGMPSKGRPPFDKEVKDEHCIPSLYAEPPVFVVCGPRATSKRNRYTDLPAAFADKSLRSRIPLVKFTEYGLGPEDAEDRRQREEGDKIDFLGGLGLDKSKDEIGVLVDRELWNRRAEGRDLLPMLVKGAAESEAKANQDLYDLLTKDKAAENRFYHGYAQGSSYVNLFFDIVIADAVSHGRHIDMTVPVRFDTKQPVEVKNLKLDFAAGEIDVPKKAIKLASVRRALLQRRLILLNQAGVGEVRVVTPAGPPTVVYRGKGKRIVRLIDFFRLSNRTFKILLSASDRLCLATGDQSWTEAISADKDVVYELGNHKKPLMASWMKLAAGKGLDDNSPMRKLCSLYTTDVFNIDVNGPVNEPTALAAVATAGQLLEAVAEANLRSEQFAAVNETIVEEYDCLPAVVRIMDQAFAAYPMDAEPDKGDPDREHAPKEKGKAPEKKRRAYKRYGGLEDTYDVIPTTGDGNCLFRAVSRVVNGNEDGHQDLRQRAVARMRGRALLYTDEVLGASSVTAYTTRQNYLDTMNVIANNAGEVEHWGGFPELGALSALLARPIYVHSSDTETEARGFIRIEGDTDNPSPGEAVPIHVLYEGGNHYVAMGPRG